MEPRAPASAPEGKVLFRQISVGTGSSALFGRSKVSLCRWRTDTPLWPV